MYKLIKDHAIFGESKVIIRLNDNAFIPLTDLSNSDYQAYLKWVAEGNTPEPAEEPT
ncbi:MAG: hypothetical protein ACK5DE_11560 [Bacteroidota bacterium]|jgi:hypothetical protein